MSLVLLTVHGQYEKVIQNFVALAFVPELASKIGFTLVELKFAKVAKQPEK